MKNSLLVNHLDLIGMVASAACAVHCVALPLLITALPFIGVSFLVDRWIEQAIVLFSLAVAVPALFHGYWKHHRNYLPLLLVGFGFVIILLGMLFGHGAHHHLVHPTGPLLQPTVQHSTLSFLHMMTPFGGLVVSAGHLVNWYAIKKSTPAV